MRPWSILALVLALLWGVHLVVTASEGFALPGSVRERVGASASTVVTRAYAQLTAPFFHDGLAHLAYNTCLFALGLPLALRAYGARALAAAYVASPAVGVAVDVLLILPLATAGNATAEGAAPVRLVGSSIVAFALLGMALASMRLRLGERWTWAIAAAVALYEAALALSGTTRPFVWAYHLGGFALGALTARLVFERARRGTASASAGAG